MKLNYAKQEVLSSEAQTQAAVLDAVDQAKLQFAADKLATRRALTEARNKVEDLKTNVPLQPAEIIKAQLEVEELENGLNKLVELEKELGLA